jgi:hypothetical protein
MAKESYKCSDCGTSFNRKWNAERLNVQKHNEMAVIYNKENNWTYGKRSASVHTAISQTYATPPSVSMRKLIPIAEGDEQMDMDKFLKFIEKLMPLVDELDMLLSRYKSYRRNKNGG